MKELKKLLIPAIIMLALIIGVAVYYAVSAKDAPEETDETNISVVSIAVNDVANLTVHKKEGEDMSFTAVGGDEQNIEWQIDGVTDAVLSQTRITSYVSMLINFNAYNKVSDPASLSEYGLDDPSFTVTITCKDGTVKVIHIGIPTYDNTYCYFMLDGDPNIYTVVLIKRTYCEYELINFLEARILDLDLGNMASVTFDRRSDDVNFTANVGVDDAGNPSYSIIDPFKIQASSYFVSLMNSISQLEISQFMEIDDSELSDYGLDEPNYNFTFRMNTGEVIELHLSEAINGFYYGYCTGVDNYFMISTMQMTGLDTGLIDLINNYIAYYPISRVSSIDCVYGDESFEFDMNVPNTISDDDAVITINGRNAKVWTSTNRSYPAILFESVACIDIAGIERRVDPELTDPVMTITIVLQSHETIKLDFVERDNESYYVFVNDEYSCFFVYERELFRDSGTDFYNYGVWPAYELLSEAIDNSINGVYDLPETGTT